MLRKFFKKNRRGQALVEFGLVLPILVLVMMAILEMGFLVRDFITVNYILSQATKEASLMRGVNSGDHHVMRKILESSYGLDPSRLKIISGTGQKYGPYTLNEDTIFNDSDVEVGSFAEPLFFYNDAGTPNDTSDDTATMASNTASSYARITIEYTHENLGPYPEFMALNNIQISATKMIRIE